MPNGKINYEKELGLTVIPKGEPLKFDRGKYTDNLPVPVVGVDPNTHEILHECESIEDAHRLGFFNIAMVVSEKYKRQLSGGVQWFKRSDFDPENIPLIHPRQSKPVLCIEQNIHFRSCIEAQEYLRSKGFQVISSSISNVLNGHRKTAGGFTFEVSNLTNDEIVKQEHYTNLDSVLCVKPKII